MNYGLIDPGEIFQIKFDSIQILEFNSNYIKEANLYFCYNDNTTFRSADSQIPWPELLEYVNPTHSASSFTLSFYTNLDGNLNE